MRRACENNRVRLDLHNLKSGVRRPSLRIAVSLGRARVILVVIETKGDEGAVLYVHFDVHCFSILAYQGSFEFK